MSKPGRTKAEGLIDRITNAQADDAPGIDRENAFMLYATFCGDVERTAHALSITGPEVINLAAEGGWNEKLRSILELKKSGKAGDVERAVNRALNFVQAHRLRLFLERVLAYICKMPNDEMDELLMSYAYDKEGNKTKKFTTRPLADLSAALEKCHVLTYLALNDSTTERRARDDAPDADLSGGELHAKIAAAMSGGSAGAQLVAAQKEITMNS